MSIWEQIDERKKEQAKPEFGLKEFSELENLRFNRNRALSFHYDFQPCNDVIYQLVRPGYNKKIVAEAKKIVENYNGDGTLKELEKE